jgi:hypothetical protein
MQDSMDENKAVEEYNYNHVADMSDTIRVPTRVKVLFHVHPSSVVFFSNFHNQSQTDGSKDLVL